MNSVAVNLKSVVVKAGICCCERWKMGAPGPDFRTWDSYAINGGMKAVC
jgi:hypothetical protein